MPGSTRIVLEAEESPVQKLWPGVIASTVEESVRAPLSKKREAEQFLFTENGDYRTACLSAGINPDDLRGRLEKIRSRRVAETPVLALRY